jgi:hypothetical protein
MNRFYADGTRFSAAHFPAVDAVRRYMDDGQGRVIWSEAAGRAGWSTAARHHGLFDNDDATLASVAYLIEAGFD